MRAAGIRTSQRPHPLRKRCAPEQRTDSVPRIRSTPSWMIDIYIVVAADTSTVWTLALLLVFLFLCAINCAAALDLVIPADEDYGGDDGEDADGRHDYTYY